MTILQSEITNSLLDQGILGVSLLLAITAIVVLWKWGTAKDKIIQSQAEKMTEVAAALTNNITNITDTTKDIPVRVENRIRPIIEKESAEIKNLLK